MLARLSSFDSVSDSFGLLLMVLLVSIGSFIRLLLVLEPLSCFDSVIFIGEVPWGCKVLLEVRIGVAASCWR